LPSWLKLSSFISSLISVRRSGCSVSRLARMSFTLWKVMSYIDLVSASALMRG
jgi:hypothetical protein